MLGAGLFAMLMAAGTPDLPARAGASLNRSAMPAAVRLGAKWGIVTSVHRSPAHNRAVGGAPNSFHLSGRAIDIARRGGVAHAEIAAAYRRAGFVLLESLDEGDHSHFAFGLPGDTPLPAPDLRKAPLFAAAPACPPVDSSARRRPDRGSDCGSEHEPSARLRPLREAP